ncbi:TetR family transcriptional regulator [Streptomyces sp. NPDC002896]|uniref:TetR family transcriptional regulator n=1 Tax=Streptomyces sp. NPDC002896 TaxID=3154438 RepID=UPI003316C9C0
MTPRQIARRQLLTDAVISLVDEIGPENVQMRNVAERSGVALGTAYRYFASKDHMLAAAWADWHRRLTDRVHAELARQRSRARREVGALDRVLSFFRREVRSFQRHPNFARLVVLVQGSSDPFASEALATVASSQDEVLVELMEGVPEEIALPARVAINAVLSTGLQEWTTGRRTIGDVQTNLESVTRLVLGSGALRGGGSAGQEVR